VNPGERDDGHRGPALLYSREDGKSVVALPAPVFDRPGGISRGASWSEGRLDYRVTGEGERGGRPCFEIEVRSPFGHKRTIWRDKDSALVAAVRETVFIGQGEQHVLVMELAEVKRLGTKELKLAEGAFAAALALRQSLNRSARSERLELTDAQLGVLRKELPPLAEKAAKTPLAALVTAAQKDLQAQRGRSGAAAAFREQIVGKEVGDFELSDLAGKPVTRKALEGKVTVLHFWQYRDSPLEEPYGQVGYLDFLLRQRARQPVQVIGISVDERAADASQRRGVASAARRFRDFMNVGYTIALDDGQFLKRFGDPRPVGGRLPVYVVIGKDGKVVEYHAGLYDVQAQEGLAELDRIIGSALKTGE
jgi:peroxiredoxin